MNKKINLIWLLSLLMMVQVCFVSCHKDDDDDVVVSTADLKTALIGSWKQVSDVYYEDGKESSLDSEYYDDNTYYVNVFNSDGTYSGYGVLNGKIDENKEFWRSIHGDWKLDGNKLIYDDDDEYFEIVSIKGNTLTLTCEWDDEDGDGKKVKCKEVETFKKLD